MNKTKWFDDEKKLGAIGTWITVGAGLLGLAGGILGGRKEQLQVDRRINEEVSKQVDKLKLPAEK